ncbi:hypothetical protein P7D22_20930 [Lichenihabitans sp. Uapishka_5]|uniref:hypothetical protein n=1 Tax=Lichenihabitans sp. Uapishka_5 TaxID=3037302 RepID=UPI0029E80914|nr:hypothetical protein [Lichenihabitans sp. Uapishka_5]MDX7953632.1 hypothetical protein [Lichenihabitans sp. Uapishka_5]
MRFFPCQPLLALLLIAGTVEAAHADEARIVPSGTNQQIDFFASVNPDCSTPGLPTVRLIDGPQAGTVTTDKGRDFMAFPHGNPRSACNKRRVAGLKMFYRAPKGFMGTDHVRILVISANGIGREASYAIQTR